MNSTGNFRGGQTRGCIGNNDFRPGEELSNEKLITRGGEEVGKGRRLVMPCRKGGEVDSARRVIRVFRSVRMCGCEYSSRERGGGCGKGKLSTKAIEFGSRWDTRRKAWARRIRRCGRHCKIQKVSTKTEQGRKNDRR